MCQGLLATVVVVALLAGSGSIAEGADGQSFNTTVKLKRGAADGALVGRVRSPARGCERGRPLLFVPETEAASLESTDRDGRFRVSVALVTLALGESFRIVALPRGIGRGRECERDRTRVLVEVVDVSFGSFAFDDGTNTFTGSIQSEDGRCEDGVDTYLARFESTGFFERQLTSSTSPSGAFSFPVEEPSPGRWRAAVPGSLLDAEIRPDGSASASYCEFEVSGEVVIP